MVFHLFGFGEKFHSELYGVRMDEKPCYLIPNRVVFDSIVSVCVCELRNTLSSFSPFMQRYDDGVVVTLRMVPLRLPAYMSKERLQDAGFWQLGHAFQRATLNNLQTVNRFYQIVIFYMPVKR